MVRKTSVARLRKMSLKQLNAHQRRIEKVITPVLRALSKERAKAKPSISKITKLNERERILFDELHKNYEAYRLCMARQET